MNGHIEGLLSTGEVIAAPADVATWFALADQRAFARDAAADPAAFWHRHAGSVAWPT
jgi:hypothetical protein